MAEILTAIFEGGAFVPEQATHVVPGARVRLVVEPIAAHVANVIDQVDEVFDRLTVNSGGARMTRDEMHERRGLD